MRKTGAHKSAVAGAYGTYKSCSDTRSTAVEEHDNRPSSYVSKAGH